MWLGISKPMIPYPLLWEGAVRTVGSHLGRIPKCSEVPDTPPTPETPGTALPGAPPRTPPSKPPPPPPRGLRPTVSWGGVVGVQDRGVAPPVGDPKVLQSRCVPASSMAACWWMLGLSALIS